MVSGFFVDLSRVGRKTFMTLRLVHLELHFEVCSNRAYPECGPPESRYSGSGWMLSGMPCVLKVSF